MKGRLCRVKIVHMETGDILTLKKPHPCGCFTFEVLRVGSDIRMKCTGCGRDVTVPREKLEKSVKKVDGEPV